jgi:hypothetical protein
MCESMDSAEPFAAFFAEHDAERDAAWRDKAIRLARETDARRARQQRKAVARLRRAWCEDGTNRNDDPERTVLSLDQRGRGDMGDAHIWAEHLAAPGHSYDPVRIAEGHLLRELLGNIDEDDVARMADYALQRLRDRLAEAGFSTGKVQRKERARLRELERHRGQGFGPITTESISTGRKDKRRQKVNAGRHSKPTQKPRNKHRQRRQVKDGWV